MEPASDATPYPTIPDGTYPIIEAETNITKEIRKHIYRAPDGKPEAFFTDLGHALDRVSDDGYGMAILVAQEWTVIVLLDQEGVHTALYEGLEHG